MLLTVEDLAVSYNGAGVVRGVTLHTAASECVAVFGPNGAGKSTLLKAVAGLLRSDRGEVLLDGERITGLDPATLGKYGIVYVPQGRRVFPSLTVYENLEIMLYRLGSRERRAAVESVFADFPALRDRSGVAAGRLSSGEQQIVALARAMVLKPKLLLLDEPTHGLSAAWVERVFVSLKALCGRGVAIVLVEQAVEKAVELADRGYVMRLGRIVREAEAANLVQAYRESGLAWTIKGERNYELSQFA
ncbi:MAG: ABC transporter ATP-binding protein [Betaproteobacteria bacterium]|nr:ABC transporter ATP-binding protein [Betaproteobacteria bacterium]